MLQLFAMEEVGIVKKVEGVTATIVIEKKSVCDQCRQGCRIGEGGAEIDALDMAGAEVGQAVKVQMKAYSYLKGSLLVYGLPALALILGAVAGREFLSQYIISVDKDLLSAIGGFSALIASFIMVKIFTARVEKKIETRPVITEILSEPLRSDSG